MCNVLIINGPNLNLLGTREPEKYGNITLADIENMLKSRAAEYKFDIKTFQSNSEGDIIDFIQQNRDWAEYLIINAGAYTHTSVAIRDAILAVKYLTIEVHLTSIYSREEFRKKSYLSDISIGVISGFGVYSYLLALDYIKYRENENEKK